MQKQFFKIFFLVTIFSMLPNFASAAENLSHITESGGTVYFASDFEDNNYTADAGSGQMNWVGGNPTRPVGDYSNCTWDINNFHYTYIDSSLVAQNAVAGSQNSLKTPYLGACPNESSQRDTTTVVTPTLTEYYVRFYQKWTGSFQNSVQQKFTKFYNPDFSTSNTLTGHLSMPPIVAPGLTGHFREFGMNLDNHFAKDGCSPSSGYIWINPDKSAVGKCYPGQGSGWDDYEGFNSRLTFELDRWYAIEIHSKLNSAPDVADAIYEVFVDGELRLANYNFRMVDGITFNTPGTNTFEFQHVYYNRSSQDQSTYMDNLVIADRPIGLLGISDTIAPSAPTGLSIQ